MYERIGIIVVVSLVMLFRTLRLGLISDDIPCQKDASKPKNAWDRIYQQLRYGAIYAPQEAHLITLIIHTLTCVFIYLGLGKSDISFLAALLFCVNPRNCQGGSIWLAGRSNYALPTLLFTASMVMPVMAPLFIFLSITHATVFLTPLGFLGSPYWWFIFFMPVLWAMSVGRFRSQVKSKIAAQSLTKDKVISINKLIIAIKTYGFYFFMCLVPDKLTFNHSFMQSGAGSGNKLMRKRSLSLDKTFWFGLAVIVAWIASSAYKWTGVSWGIFWFSISILPYLNIIRVQQEAAERYVYCANVGLMYALACILISYPYAMAAFLAIYAIRLYYNIPAWTDEYLMREFSVIEDPASWYAWHNRAMLRWDIQSYHEAMINWVIALKISPQEFKILINLAIAARLLKKFQDSKKFLEAAENNIIEGQEEAARYTIKKVREGTQPILL